MFNFNALILDIIYTFMTLIVEIALMPINGIVSGTFWIHIILTLGRDFSQVLGVLFRFCLQMFKDYERS